MSESSNDETPAKRLRLIGQVSRQVDEQLASTSSVSVPEPNEDSRARSAGTTSWRVETLPQTTRQSSQASSESPSPPRSSSSSGHSSNSVSLASEESEPEFGPPNGGYWAPNGTYVPVGHFLYCDQAIEKDVYFEAMLMKNPQSSRRHGFNDILAGARTCRGFRDEPKNLLNVVAIKPTRKTADTTTPCYCGI